MEWQSEDHLDWVQDAERWIAQIKGVLQAKIDVDGSGDVTGVHVVARHDRDPRHIVRDVEGLLKARLGIAVFYKKIGVVQVVEPTVEPLRPQNEFADAGLDDETAAEAVLLAEEMAPRIKCLGVGLRCTETTMCVDVQLRAAGLETRGTAEGPNRNAIDLSLVAQATLAGIIEMLDESVVLNLSEIRLDRLGGHDVVLAAVELSEGRRSERLFGACQPQHNLHQAVVFAVLDALNRRLALMAFKSNAAAE